MAKFETKQLSVERDAVAADGSDVRILLELKGGGMAHFELGPNQTSKAVTHQTVMDIGQFGQKVKPKLATKLKAIDLLNQMEGVYVTKIESKTAQLVELAIITDPDLPNPQQ